MRRSYPDSLLLFLLMRTPPTDMYTLPYTTLFRSNNNRAICSYGTCLENGIGIEKNEEEAWKYYEKAEKAGKGLNPKLILCKAICYIWGKGDPKDKIGRAHV